MDARELIKGVRQALSVRQVFGEPVERDGVTVIPAATVMGGGGAGSGESIGKPSTGDSEAAPQEEQASSGAGFGGVMWPAGAFEIKDGRVTWRPAIDLTRVLVMVLVLAIALVRAGGRRRN